MSGARSTRAGSPALSQPMLDGSRATFALSGPARARAWPFGPWVPWVVPLATRKIVMVLMVGTEQIIPAVGSPDGCLALGLMEGTGPSRVTEAGITRTRPELTYGT